MSRPRSLIFGVGVNDDKNVTGKLINGKLVQCPFYRKWCDMLARCYAESYKKAKPSYDGCCVADQWLKFSNFKAWMETQDWKGKELDKDLLAKGNKIYSPETCVFVSHAINGFLACNESNEELGKTGVYAHKTCVRFSAKCKNPFTKKFEYIGCFLTSEDAHAAWKMRKHQHACRLADLQTDERVANALRTRYL